MKTAVIIVSCLLFAASAQAVPVVGYFSGYIDQIDGPENGVGYGGVQLYDRFVGKFWYDSDMNPQLEHEDFIYNAVDFGFGYMLRFPTFTYIAPNGGPLSVIAFPGSFSVDDGVGSFTPFDTTFWLDDIVWGLSGPSSVLLPNETLDDFYFSSGSLYVEVTAFTLPDPQAEFWYPFGGEITNFNISPVPEPSTIMLISIGLLIGAYIINRRRLNRLDI